MKRKLSVAMSFVGAPKIVILDEPTAVCDLEVTNRNIISDEALETLDREF